MLFFTIIVRSITFVILGSSDERFSVLIGVIGIVDVRDKMNEWNTILVM